MAVFPKVRTSSETAVSKKRLRSVCSGPWNRAAALARAALMTSETTSRNASAKTRPREKIRDRGPYVDSRRCIIDLSRAAACRLGFEHPGLAPVRVVVKKAPARSTRMAQAPLPRRS